MARFLFLLVAVLFSSPLRAVENIPSSSFNLTPPTSTDIPNWTSGWTQPAAQPTGYTYTTGWNYVGSVNGSSAVYLGNNWVLTAAHVSPGNFYLNGTTYTMIPGTAQEIGSTDLQLLQISTAPALPALPLRSTDPVANSSLVAILGWGAGGGDRNETWGYNTINYPVNQSISVTGSTGTTYTSNGFITLTEFNEHNPDNLYQVVVGDSGGADFIYNSTAGRWELAGMNDGDGTVTYSDGTGGYSAFVQVDTYYTAIMNIISQPLPAPTDSPTMPPPALGAFGLLLFLVAARYLGPESAASKSKQNC